MPRTFAYLRVSTSGQTIDNQLTEIQAAGFTIEQARQLLACLRAEGLYG